MGTRADFYVGRGVSAEWLGSKAWDGYPGEPGVPERLLRQDTEEGWRREVADFLAGEQDATLPERGWPWPWKDSSATDYTYSFDEGQAWVSRFGSPWLSGFRALEEDHEFEEVPKVEFPDMSGRRNMRLDHGSGLIALSFKFKQDEERWR